MPRPSIHYQISFKISDNQLNRHSLKHTNQRNVMCPYCRKRFKSKATCRTHMLIHKSEWVKQFKEQIKSGAIQIEEDVPNQTNDHIMLNIMPSNEDILNFNDPHIESHDTSNLDIQENNQVLFTNLVQETQMDDSRNQFEYFLLLPTSSESNENGIVTVDSSETEQFIVNDEQLSFSNLHFIQLEHPPLLEMENFNSTPLLSNCRINVGIPIETQPTEQGKQTHLNVDCPSNLSNVPVTSPEKILEIVTTTESNQSALTSKSRARKSTKSINNCHLCTKIFQKPIDLRRHIRTHTLEKVFILKNSVLKIILLRCLAFQLQPLP